MSSPLVLIVDDDPDTRQMYEVGLSLLGMFVVVSADADEAFRVACEVRPHAVVTDVALAGRRGYRLAERLRANPDTAAIPVLMLTAWTGVEHRVRAQRAGCVALLLKPCPPDVLFHQIQSALASRRSPVEVGAAMGEAMSMIGSRCLPGH